MKQTIVFQSLDKTFTFKHLLKRVNPTTFVGYLKNMLNNNNKPILAAASMQCCCCM